MSLEGHILDTHLNNFNQSLGAYKEEQAEHFNSEILDVERLNQSSYNENIMGDCMYILWVVICDEEAYCITMVNLLIQLIFY